MSVFTHHAFGGSIRQSTTPTNPTNPTNPTVSMDRVVINQAEITVATIPSIKLGDVVITEEFINNLIETNKAFKEKIDTLEKLAGISDEDVNKALEQSRNAIDDLEL